MITGSALTSLFAATMSSSYASNFTALDNIMKAQPVVTFGNGSTIGSVNLIEITYANTDNNNNGNTTP